MKNAQLESRKMTTPFDELVYNGLSYYYCLLVDSSEIEGG